MDEPIATYREARFELRRRFDLYPDRIRVTGKGLYIGRFDTVIPLSILNPEPNWVWVRGQLFRYGVLALIFAVCGVVGRLAGGGPEGLLSPWAIGVLGGVAWLGLMLTLANIRRVEFAAFTRKAGVTALDIGRVGPQNEDFDEFLDLLIAQIRAARPSS
jgi:hypothetical protein